MTPPEVHASSVERQGPPSTRATEARGARTGPTSTRMEELAHLYRKIADMQAELAETEARLEKARRESAGADEMVGQMLARMGEVEGRLGATQKQLADAEARAANAETRAGELTAQLGKARAAHGELGERLRAAESRLSGDRREYDRLRSELEAARTEATVAIAAAEEAQDGVIKERDQIVSLRSDLAREVALRQRERDERESLRLRVSELAIVCDERDKALAREEMLEAELETARREITETKLRATSGEHRLGDQIADQTHRIEELDGQLGELRSKQSWVEKELAATRRELANARDAVERERAARDAAEAHAAEMATAGDRARDAAEAARRARASIEEQLAEALHELDAIAKAKGEAERRAAEAEHITRESRAEAEAAAREVRAEADQVVAGLRAELGATRAELDAARAKLGDLEIERELHDGLDARNRAAHDTEISAMRAAHAAEVERLRASIDEASEAAARSHYEVLTRGEELGAARRDLAAAIAARDAATSAERAFEGGLQRELDAAKRRAAEMHAKFRSALADVSRMLGDLERQEAEAARARGAALASALDVLDQAALAEDDIAGVVHDLGRPKLLADDEEETRIFSALPREAAPLDR